MARTRAAKPSVDPAVRLVVSREFDYHTLRAVVTGRPGGAPELVLQRIDNGDEAEPYTITREVTVAHKALNQIDSATWTDDGLVFSEGEGDRVKTWFVRATADTFETKAISND